MRNAECTASPDQPAFLINRSANPTLDRIPVSLPGSNPHSFLYGRIAPEAPFSPVHQSHSCLRIPRSGRSPGREDLVEAAEVLGGKADLQRLQILSRYVRLFVPNIARCPPLCQEPTEGELPSGATFLGRHFLEPIDQSQVLLQILALKTRGSASEIVFSQLFESRIWPVRKPRPIGP